MRLYGTARLILYFVKLQTEVQILEKVLEVMELEFKFCIKI